MSFTWSPEDEPELPKLTAGGVLRAVLRAAPLAAVLTLGAVTMVAARLIERPVYGMARPFTPFITIAVCRVGLRIVGLRYSSEGEVMRRRGGVVANHSSWLDIFVLNARKRIYFVSKAEVERWPGIGQLAKMTGTVFIARDPKQAKAQTQLFEERLMAGHKLLFFPEGTSTDGVRVLPFKTTLFQAFFSDTLREEMHIQPVTLIYMAPDQTDDRFYGWWGDMSFGGHLLQILAARRHGRVKVIYHAPVKVADFPNRKALAIHVEDVVRGGMPPERQQKG